MSLTSGSRRALSGPHQFSLHSPRYSLRRGRIQNPSQGFNGNDFQLPPQIPEAKEVYLARVRTEYDRLLKQLQERCRLEAEKHYFQACRVARINFYMNIVAVVLGCVSLWGVGLFVTQRISSVGSASVTSLQWSQLGVAGVGTILLGWHLEFIAKRSASLLATDQKRSKQHTQSTFGWQHLKHEIRATRLLLRNPDVNITEVDQKYREHIKTRKELSEKVIIVAENQPRGSIGI